ncbi:MAG: hypothetical protein FGM49_03815 [Candidatus Nanopelagicaceae bacterium]|nr:hypothetical protein [Candidatus Nanopelagicaceae bacterium]
MNDSIDVGDVDFDFVLVGNIDNVLINLPLGLKQAGFKTLLIGAKGMKLLSDPNIDKVIRLDNSGQSEFVEELLQKQKFLSKCTGTFLWCSDEIMKVVANSSASSELKKKILPFRNPEFFKMLDSKVCQDNVFKSLGINTPESYVIDSATEKSVPNIDGASTPVMIKRDSSGGGAFIKVAGRNSSISIDAIPKNWFPILIQDFVPGRTVSVEAFYREGELKFWLYSLFEKETSRFGPSVVRQYLTPLNLDFLDPLSRLGKQGLITGFVNATFILSRETDEHIIIEFDARPNIWHQAFGNFGVPFKSLWESPASTKSVAENLPKTLLYEPYRLFNHFLSRLNILGAVRVILGHEFTNYGSPVLSTFYLAFNRKSNLLRLCLFPLMPFRNVLLKATVVVKGKLPRRVGIWIDNSALKGFILKLLIR